MPKPLHFTAPEAAAALAGRKTRHTLILKPQPVLDKRGHPLIGGTTYLDGEHWRRFPCAIGDVVPVKEPWAQSGASGGVSYRADMNSPCGGFGWRSSAIMPAWAVRMSARITDVKILRAQETTEGEAAAEWGEESDFLTAYGVFCDRFVIRHGRSTWDANPWVCAISFQIERATK